MRFHRGTPNDKPARMSSGADLGFGAQRKMWPASIICGLIAKIRHKIIWRQRHRTCSVCATSVRNFTALPNHYTVNQRRFGRKLRAQDAETLNVKHYSCPACGASDRDRLAALYLRPYLRQVASNHPVRLLHFAPSPALSSFVR